MRRGSVEHAASASGTMSSIDRALSLAPHLARIHRRSHSSAEWPSSVALSALRVGRLISSMRVGRVALSSTRLVSLCGCGAMSSRSRSHIARILGLVNKVTISNITPSAVCCGRVALLGTRQWRAKSLRSRSHSRLYSPAHSSRQPTVAIDNVSSVSRRLLYTRASAGVWLFRAHG